MQTENAPATAGIWIIGCGDIGRRTAKLYSDSATVLQGIVQSDESAQHCRETGVNCLQLDLDQDALPDASVFSACDMYYFAPPPRSGNIDSRLRRFLEQVGDAPRKLVLISTTGVYGNTAGGWVDESSPPNPATDRARRRLDAEQSLTAWADQWNKPYVILRVPGIYAPDRLPLARLKKGLPVVKSDDAPWTNRIHADDLARICCAAMSSAVSGVTLNATDGTPGTMTDYFNQVADFAGLPRPPQISLAAAREQLSPGMVSYLNESRRISNTFMLQTLGIDLLYPSLEAGLKQPEKTS